MDAEIIAVGSELLTPDHTDTNSLYLTRRLNEAGFQVRIKTVVGDRESDVGDVLRSALRRSRLILLTGGLGPTEDDVTRRAVAGVLERPLELDPAALARLRHLFESRGYAMPSINERQAEVIRGSEVIPNRFGTAPGLWVEERGTSLGLLPGPPRELRPMFEEHILPRVRRIAGARRMIRRTIRVAGMTESQVDARAAPLYRECIAVQTTILAARGHIELVLTQWEDRDYGGGEIDELEALILGALGPAVFSTRGEDLEAVVGRVLREAGTTLAIAESCTAGMLGMLITRVPGSSDYFLGGFLCYSNESKMELAGVPRSLLDAHGAVSAETAEALASGVRYRLGSGVGLAITGIAGPGGATDEKPVGLVYVGLADHARRVHHRRVLPGDREAIRERASYFALACLRKFLRV